MLPILRCVSPLPVRPTFVAFQRSSSPPKYRSWNLRTRQFGASSRVHSSEEQPTSDPRLKDLSRHGQILEGEYATIRENYDSPRNAIVLAHGLLGFDELHPFGRMLPGIQYWRGITEALDARGIECIITAVPPSGSIEARAAHLAENIRKKAPGKDVNIIAHSMGGLDARYMISQIFNQPDKPQDRVTVRSLTTIASPHRGSAFADYMLDSIGPEYLARVYKALQHFGLETEAFAQLTRDYMQQTFNPCTPNVEGVKYYSYGATFTPHALSVFRPSHAVIEKVEGANDGLVSVESSQWGEYKGTLLDVSHLDLINWTNRWKWLLWELGAKKRSFNAIALYLDIADMLAKEGL